MKICITFIFGILCFTKVFSQTSEQSIIQLIDAYSEARESNDTLLLESILHNDVDQLVSSGIWRKGKAASKEGMLKSSNVNPGSRKLIVESVRFLNLTTAIADARYEISNPDGSERKMWSTFVAVLENNQWKITAIRNMLPNK
jgi:uncharacterized protein (TIGR02246 family)